MDCTVARLAIWRLETGGDLDSVMNGLERQPEWTSSFASGAEIFPAMMEEQ